MRRLLLLSCCLMSVGCATTTTNEKPYVIEVVTFNYKPSVDAAEFWRRDAKIETDYTSRQPGFISRESGRSDDSGEVLVIVRWETQADADASMRKFMGDDSVEDFVEMIDASTMKMKRYEVK